jgi:DNA-binding CsgD family transcriptional regulator
MGETLPLLSADAGVTAGAGREESLSAHRPQSCRTAGAERGNIHARSFCFPRGGGALSVRQREVLELAAGGLLDREIGAALHLSPQTVRHTLQAAREKLGARNTVHAVALALHQNLIALEEESDRRE